MVSAKRGSKRTKPRKRHLALTIVLSAKEFQFIDDCVALKEFRSVDELFGASLSFYRKHLEAIQEYAEDQLARGHSRAEILERIEIETVITKAAHSRRRRKRAKR
ncbi:hypothetical protein [Steroidobacter sp.]|uniref:hypothetical protein n=1 Tax=Steroidobacter sp. TaxID=1978227 RepID=UPI001A4FAAB7|nr:hypothetical protein [Steroidobacter sp.]MBL8267486.1 hypothetical protein [Steroidobacter sp.]